MGSDALGLTEARRQPAASLVTDTRLRSDLVDRAAKPRELALASVKLLLPFPLGPGQLNRYALTAPRQICQALKVGALATSWSASPIYAGDWECMATADTVIDGYPADPRGRGAAETDASAPNADGARSGYRIFTMARGRSVQTVSYVRVKLSASGSASSARGAEALVGIASSLFGELDWQLPADVAERLRARQSFDMTMFGTRMIFLKEHGESERFDLIVDFPNSQPFLAALEHDRFLAPVSSK